MEVHFIFLEVDFSVVIADGGSQSTILKTACLAAYFRLTNFNVSLKYG